MDRDVDVVAAHAAIAPRDLLIQERRNLYALASELAGSSDLSLAALDSPVVRAAIGRFLAGTSDLAPTDLVTLDVLSGREHLLPAGPGRIALAARPAAREHLAEVVQIVAAHASAVDPAAGSPSVMTEADGPELARASALIAAGVELALAVDPELLDDLLPHIAVVAVLDRATAGRLGSASARECPGLVLLPAPDSAIEVAEALVHEGAHQKVFDLGVTRDLLGGAARSAPAYRPTWAPAPTAWPLEQVFAAWHAYTCLARFWSRLPEQDRATVAPASLLPVAGRRAPELAERLLSAGACLGSDAHDLLAHVTGHRPTAAPATPREGSIVDVERWIADGTLIHRRAPDGCRTVAGRAGPPPEIFWLTDVDLTRHTTHPG